MSIQEKVWIQTYSGRVITIESPREDDIDIVDIAHALSLICRFGGHTTKFYSVADHSIRVSELLPVEFALWGLLHDASEAYLVDIPRPLKIYLGKSYKNIEQVFMQLIAKKFKLEWPEPQLVKACDNILLITERRDLIVEQSQDWKIYGKPLQEKIIPLSWMQAKREFLKTFNALR